MRRVTLALLAAAGLWSCPAVDPNAGRFSCAAEADCGEGFTCRPQFGGGGRCFRAGECADVETCDGTDENCDGRIDETFPEEGRACATGVPGACAVGVRSCVVGALACRQTVLPSAELCNGVDDDCDGEVDEVFDLSSDEANCGACGTRCVAGTMCLAGGCRESVCDDGVDNDGDGRADCADDACLGLVCFADVAPSWRCGTPRLDAGADDGGLQDAGVADAGAADGGADAGGAPDAGGSDAGAGDAGAGDGGQGPDGGATDAGAADGGGEDAGSADGGPGPGCRAPELDCANGLDDDGDGDVDCLDADCDGATCASGATCTNRACLGP